MKKAIIICCIVIPMGSLVFSAWGRHAAKSSAKQYSDKNPTDISMYSKADQARIRIHVDKEKKELYAILKDCNRDAETARGKMRDKSINSKEELLAFCNSKRSYLDDYLELDIIYGESQ